MYKTKLSIRVRYSETDRMGYVYYGNYAQYFEVARVEALRELGIIYKDLEDSGIVLPVFEFNTKFLKPAFYDELITIKTTIKELPSVRINFSFECFNENKEKLNEAKVTLVFFDFNLKKPCSPPAWVIEKFKDFFN